MIKEENRKLKIQSEYEDSFNKSKTLYNNKQSKKIMEIEKIYTENMKFSLRLSNIKPKINTL